MRVLIDTNIFIELEGTNVLAGAYPELLTLLKNAGAHILVHPASIDDLQRDQNKQRRQSNLSRVAKYTLLDRPPDCNFEFAQVQMNCTNNPHDLADCAILCAVFKDAVHFLVTEDQGIHRKAKRLGIDGRVLYVQQALSSFGVAFNSDPIRLPNIEQVFVYEIKNTLETKFFDSLRQSYEGFDNWFIDSCCRDGREAWVVRDQDGALAAICIFKEQNSEPITEDKRALSGRSLKLCTFKVGDSVRGKKIGELFLKAAFRYARQRELQNIFLTVKTGQQSHLENLLSDFGFESFGVLSDETVMVKQHPTSPPPKLGLSPLEYHKRFWPHLKVDPNVDKFIIPILPKFHKQLFADWKFHGTQLKLPITSEQAELGNALKLAYLCHSNISTIKPGDILLFYRSTDFQELTTIGIVETVTALQDADEILKLVLKRTVYSASEITEMARKKTLVVLFRLGLHLTNPVTRKSMVANGIRGNIQSIRKIEQKAFEDIVRQGGLEDCVFINKAGIRDKTS